LTGWLAARGEEAVYVDDVLSPPAKDDDIWEFAAAHAATQ
jgi:hypothetical protein